MPNGHLNILPPLEVTSLVHMARHCRTHLHLFRNAWAPCHSILSSDMRAQSPPGCHRTTDCTLGVFAGWCNQFTWDQDPNPSGGNILSVGQGCEWFPRLNPSFYTRTLCFIRKGVYASYWTYDTSTATCCFACLRTMPC